MPKRAEQPAEALFTPGASTRQATLNHHYFQKIT
jgi:hypothetical protein